VPARSSSVFFLLAACVCAGCSGYTPIVRDTVPEQRPEVDISLTRSALIRTADCDISVMQISREEWDNIASNRMYLLEVRNDAPRMLPYEMYQVVITNSSERNLSGIEFSARYGEYTVAGEPAASVIKKCSSPVYKNISFEKLLKPRRIVSNEYLSEKDTYDGDSLEYPFPFVLPLDTVRYYALLPQIPADVRNFTVIVTYTVDNTKKNVDFKFKRLEHREKE